MDDESLSGLLCQETELFFEEEVVVNEDSFINSSNSLISAADEYVEMLIDREISFGFKKSESLVLDNWFKCARLEAITWILKTRALFGFRFQTAYLSVIYFDRFLSRRSINSEQSWAIKLLSVACLSLAAKMEELKVPSLSEFQIEEYNFESKVIQRMELLVLNTLEWKMGSITPFAFLHYFITKLCKDSPPSHVVSRAIQLILATMREINLMEHRPSVMAAAATLVALDQRLTRKALECKMHPISYCGFLEIEQVFECYNLMQKWPTRLRPIDVLDNSSVSSAVISKRKRLIFNTCDESPDIPNEKRLC